MGREYGAIMYQLKFPTWNKILSQIDEDDVYTDPENKIFGYEYEPHVTLVHGFHKEIDHKELIEDMYQLKSVDVKLTGVSGFENDEFDVLKIDVSPDNLIKYRNHFLEKYKNTQDFEDYAPHITLAYLKKGTGKKYFNNKPIGKVETTEVKYSSPVGHNIYVKI